MDDFSKDSIRRNFSILRYKFRTKKLQDDYLQKIRETFELQTSFYLSFYSFKKPIKKHLNHISKIYTIEEVSKEKLKTNSRTRFFFVEKLDCNNYLVYETYLRYEE